MLLWLLWHEYTPEWYCKRLESYHSEVYTLHTSSVNCTWKFTGIFWLTKRDHKTMQFLDSLQYSGGLTNTTPEALQWFSDPYQGPSVLVWPTPGPCSGSRPTPGAYSGGLADTRGPEVVVRPTQGALEGYSLRCGLVHRYHLQTVC